MRAGFWQIARWKDVPVVLHWSALLPLVWMTLKYRNITEAVVPFLAVLVLMLVHEWGHALAARRRGLEVTGICLYFMLGVCLHEDAEREEDDVFVAWGGVLAQMVLLAVSLVVLWAAGAFLPGSARVLMPVLFVFIHLNVVTAVINLIPVAPLDGHRAWRAVPLLWRRLRARSAADDLLDRMRKK